MEKGQVLKGQRFERYFMGAVETVDATIIDTIGEFHLIVKIGTENHLVSFSLDGTMRSRGLVNTTTQAKGTDMKKADRTTLDIYLWDKYQYCGNPRKMQIAKDGAVSILVDTMPNTSHAGRIFVGWDSELLQESKR